MQDPSQVHYVAAKRVLRYLKGTRTFGMHFLKSDSMELIGFSDSDWGGSEEMIIVLVSAYVVAKQLMWLRKILCDLGCIQQSPTILLCDNTSAITISKNSVFHDKTKHMKIKYHAIRQY